MKSTALALLGLPVVALLGAPAGAYPNSSTTCYDFGGITRCSSNSRSGFNGQAYTFGGTTYLNGHSNGQRISCRSYQLGYSIKTDCN